jgi:hypothetical protein
MVKRGKMDIPDTIYGLSRWIAPTHIWTLPVLNYTGTSMKSEGFKVVLWSQCPLLVK